MEAKHAGHGITDIHFDHHDDGTHTIHYHHEGGKVKSHAVMDLDGLHDSLESHLRMPQAKEDQLEEKIHPGIHGEVQKLADKKAEEGV